MKKKKLLAGLIPVLAVLALLYAGCQQSPVGPDVDDPSTNQEAFLKLISEDEVVASFEPNYNEEDAAAFLGKVSTEIYPFRVGHRVSMVNRELVTEEIGDTTYGTVTSTFEGTLMIAASYSAESTEPDTIIQKPFTSVVVRKVIFAKIDSTERPLRNWKVAAVSLPEGGTLSANIDITKLTVTLPDGEQLIVTSPNDYFMIREDRRHEGDPGNGGPGGGNPGNGGNPGGGILPGGPGNGHEGGRGHHFGRGFMDDMPSFNNGEEIKVTVELNSAYADSDLVALKWGAGPGNKQGRKRKFELISSVSSGSGYAKVFEQTYMVEGPGFFHAIISAIPKQVIHDDAAPVEESIWGIPYVVKQ